MNVENDYNYCSENGLLNLLARLTVDESYSNIELSEYTSQLTSSVETIGAVLVTNGDCTLNDTTVAANISIRTNQSEGYSFSFFVIGMAMFFITIPHF